MDRGNESIYKRIKELSQSHQMEPLYRSELDTILSRDGYKFDYKELGLLVREAYEFFSNDEAIRRAFVDQSTGRNLVDSSRAIESLQSMVPDLVKRTFEVTLDQTRNSLSDLEQWLKTTESGAITVAGNKLMDVVQGTAGVVKIQKQATATFEQFKGLVDGYERSKNDLTHLITDFTYVRNSIVDAYRTYSSQLLDLFGDKIRVVAPDLFDFDKIEWLDVDAINKDNELKFHTLIKSSYEIMSLISQSFQDKAKSVLSTLGNRQVTNEVKGILVAVDIFSHYANAQFNTKRLKGQYNSFVSKLLMDRDWIVTDMERLYAIYKSINDVALYKADTFVKRQKEVLQEGMSDLMSALYNTSELKELNEKRASLLVQIKHVEDQLADTDGSITAYQSSAEQFTHTVNNLRPLYNRAEAEKPNKPSVILNLLTFGQKKKKYQQRLYLWNDEYGYVVEEYQDAEANQAYFNGEIKELEKKAERLKPELVKLNNELKKLNATIMEKIKPNQALRAEVGKNLKDIVMMLRLAREIANTTIDEALVKAVEVDYNDTSSIQSEANERAIDKFVAELQGSIRDVADSQHNALEGDREAVSSVADAGEGLATLLGSYVKLAQQNEVNRGNREAYTKALAPLKERFQQIIRDCDNQSILLRNAVAKVNLAGDRDTLSKAFAELSDGSIKLSDKEIDAFLNGEHIIEL